MCICIDWTANIGLFGLLMLLAPGFLKVDILVTTCQSSTSIHTRAANSICRGVVSKSKKAGTMFHNQDNYEYHVHYHCITNSLDMSLGVVLQL